MTDQVADSAVLQAQMAEVVGWETAHRDDAGVAHELHAAHAVDEVHAIQEAGFIDEFFHYIREIGAWPLLESLDPQKRSRESYPFLQFVLLTIMRSVSGVSSMLAMREVLLTDESLMALLGFNAHQVQHGANGRGVRSCTEPVAIRGALSYETVADNIVKIDAEKLAEMFNGAIRCLAAHGVFPKQLDVALDATDDEATPTYTTDDGRAVPHVTREKRPDVRANRHARKVKVTVFGWKVWLVWEPVSKIPLALVIDGINVSDNTHALTVLRQAQENVKGYATIRSVALDRGFLDGKLLSAIEQDDIMIYIPAKSSMNITQDAREIARRAEAAHARGESIDGCVYRDRVVRVTHGAGKNATTEICTTELVGIRDLPCDWWCAEGSSSKANAKDFVPHSLRATVVLRWDGAPKDAEKEVVILTTDPSDDPFVAFDAYDRRSLIENSCNREAKEHWFLEHHPKRSESGMRVQTYFVFACIALVTGFRAWRCKNDAAERRGKNTGIKRYRRNLGMVNRDKVAVFIGDRYGIFRTFEMLLLLDVPVRDRTVAGATAETVLARYASKVPQPDS